MDLQDLIKEGRQRLCGIIEKHGDWGVWYEYHDADAYQKWLGITRRYINTYYRGDKDVERFEKLAEEHLTRTQQQEMLAILEALAEMPQVVPTNISSPQPKISIINNNSNIQNVVLDVFVESIKDELTGKQQKMLKEIVSDDGKTEDEKRDSLIDKLKSFGGDVLSNIIANIITNPAIAQGFIG